MKKTILYLLLACSPLLADAQLTSTQANAENEPAPVMPVPSERQLLWNETEFYAFFHYGMNTFTGREWGNGDEDEAIYAPTRKPDPEQWLRACKAAGMKGGIAVVKHHDGFCLWPTQTTGHNMTKAGSTYGREANIPQLFGDAARKLDMKYGFYVSPWDRNSYYYGLPEYVSKVFLRQCIELAQYGDDQFEMWFDGANGGTGYYGGRTNKVTIDRDTYYNIPALRDSIHQLCPNCVMWGEGNEARWIGNEAGYAGETCWSTISEGERNQRILNTGQENGDTWKPGESDAKITDAGWFWHEGETVKTPERLFQMYLETVGRNANLILNCPPNREGLLPKATVQCLKQLGQLLQQRLGKDLACKADIACSETRTAGEHRSYEPKNLTDNDKETYWATNDGSHQATITLTWKKEQILRYILMQEYIRLGQRVKSFTIETSSDGQHWTRQGGDIATTTIGYKRIIPLNGSTEQSYDKGVKARYLRITIADSKACPVLSNVQVF